MTTTLINPAAITNKQNSLKQPTWKLKMQKEIEEYREEISILDEMIKGAKMKIRKARIIKRKYEITSIDKIRTIKEKLKQEIHLKAQHMSRYERPIKLFKPNKIFQDNSKIFYREIGKEIMNAKQTLSSEVLKTFWDIVWSYKLYNKKARWIENVKGSYQNIEPQITKMSG